MLVKYLLWLLAAGWVFSLSVIVNNFYEQRNTYPALHAAYQQHVRKQEAAFADFLSTDRPLLDRLAQQQHSLADMQQVQALPFALYLFEDVRNAPPFFWSTNDVVPPLWMADVGETGQLLKYGNGYYEVLLQRISLGGRTVKIVALIQLYREYFIDNARLRKGFPGFPGLDGRMSFSVRPTSYSIEGAKGQLLFYMQPATDQPIRQFSWLSFAIDFVTLLMLILLVSHVAHSVIRQGAVMQGFLLFFIGFLVLWFCIRQFGFPFNLNHFSWLEQHDSFALPPVGLLKLLQNSLFVFWMGLFLTMQAQQVGAMLTGLNYKMKAFIAAMLTAATITIHFGVVEKLCQLYLSSSVAFDFNNFFSLDYTTVLAFLVLFLMVLAHLMLVRFFTRSILFITAGNIRFVLLVILLGGLITLSVSWFLQFKLQLLFSMLWLLLVAWFICRYPRPAFPVSTGRLVTWLFVYSLSIGVLLVNLSSARLRGRINEIGKSLLMQNDQTSEYLVRFASGGIRRINWASLLEQSKDTARSNAIRDSLVQRHFSGYLSRFVTRIYFFDAQHQPVNNPGPESFESLSTLFQTNPKEEGYPWVASFEEAFDRFGYIMQFEVANGDGSESPAYVFVTTRSVVLRNALLAPELFRQIQDFAVDLPAGFSYAWYRDQRLVEQYRNYPFPSVLPQGAQFRTSVWNRDTDDAYETWINAGESSVLAVAGQRKLLLGMVSMVAYLFGAFLTLFLILRMLGAFTQNRFFESGIFRPVAFTIQAQIRITIISILAVSFVIVAYITIRFFVNQYRNNNDERLAKNAASASQVLTQRLPENLGTYDPAGRASIAEPELQRLASNLDIDVNFYDSSGLLMASTQNVLFLKEVISNRMNPIAFYQLTKGRLHRYIENDQIGNLPYSSIYQPVRGSGGQLIGYLQIPYFATQNELKQEISNFVVILINIIAFVFLLSGGLALLISSSITRSFAVVAERMNQLRLSEKNERIEWQGKNEIGVLVEQYNRMVDQLESSAAMLKQNERELAWREMARQVAHEIKNPLTPMKLSLQFLQKAIKEKHADVPLISERVATNLVGQIDHLSRIAFEFSQFANIGNAKLQQFDLHAVLKDLILLYEIQENLEIDWKKLPQPLTLNADVTQMNRLFTNLIQNAAESVGSDQPIHIEISESIRGNRVLIAIADNGPGIPLEVQPRIFMPNFTTKSSGTGLGLAICKAIVEKAGGNIWFSTQPGEGTTFFVELPLLRPA